MTTKESLCIDFANLSYDWLSWLIACVSCGDKAERAPSVSLQFLGLHFQSCVSKVAVYMFYSTEVLEGIISRLAAIPEAFHRNEILLRCGYNLLSRAQEGKLG